MTAGRFWPVSHFLKPSRPRERASAPFQPVRVPVGRFSFSALRLLPASPTARPRAHFLKTAIKMPFWRLFPPTGCSQLICQPLPALRSVSCIFRSASTDSCLQTTQQHKIPQAQKGGSAPPRAHHRGNFATTLPGNSFPRCAPVETFSIPPGSTK